MFFEYVNRAKDSVKDYSDKMHLSRTFFFYGFHVVFPSTDQPIIHYMSPRYFTVLVSPHSFMRHYGGHLLLCLVSSKIFKQLSCSLLHIKYAHPLTQATGTGTTTTTTISEAKITEAITEEASAPATSTHTHTQKTKQAQYNKLKQQRNTK
jgi:hypothetical protein